MDMLTDRSRTPSWTVLSVSGSRWVLSVHRIFSACVATPVQLMLFLFAICYWDLLVTASFICKYMIWKEISFKRKVYAVEDHDWI